MKTTKGVIVILTSFLLFMFIDFAGVPSIFIWLSATIFGAIALGLDILEKRNVE